MITMKKSLKILEILKSEYPALNDAAITIKYGFTFKARKNNSGKYIIFMDARFDKKSYFCNNIWKFLELEYAINSLTFNIFAGSTECFALLHEIGHIAMSEYNVVSFKDAHAEYLLLKERALSSATNDKYDKFCGYRRLKAEKYADKFALDIMMGEIYYKIHAIINDISEEKAKDDIDAWRRLISNLA